MERSLNRSALGAAGRRQHDRQRSWFVSAILVLVPNLFFSPVASADSPPPPTSGDAIVVGSIGDASRLLPILATDSASGDIVGLLFNGLLKYNERLEIVGDLAESWTVSEDGLTFTFHLRPNVRWHDGAAVTARDVEFTYRKLIDPNVRTPYSSSYELVQSLDVLDDHTVRIRYKEPFAPALESWMMGVIPKHLLEGQDLNTTPFLRKPVGHGPYTFVRWKTGELIELKANPDYFEHRPYIDRYLYRIIPDEATLFLELLTQGVDLSSLTPLQYRRQTNSPFMQRAYHKFRYPSFGFTYLGYNLQDERFKDIRVRQAINRAIDKQALIEGVLYGLGAIATGPYPKESWGYDPSIVPTPYDPRAAKALLAEAGWSDHDGDGWLDRNGQRFQFTILTNQGNEVRRQVAELIQQQLKAVGIDVKIRTVEWSTFVHEFIDKRRFEAVLLGWSLSRDPDLYDLFHSSKTKEGEYNFVGYANPDVDRLLLEGRRTFDHEQRVRIYHDVHRHLYEDQPYTFLFVSDALPMLSSRFRNVVPTPIGIGYNFIDWYAPRSEQRYHAVMQQ
ncbi:MAG: peptide-binding protein [Candidatus Omnitrophica bacterium]|nr:peptide-binding protein [Candidatus Omnitrophota bacterium]